MTSPDAEHVFWAWSGRAVFAGLAASVIWYGRQLWKQAHETLPAQLNELYRSLAKDYVTRPELMKLENDLKTVIKEHAQTQTEQRKQMHDENSSKLDTIGTDVRALRVLCAEDLRRAHNRIDEHISRHHTK